MKKYIKYLRYLFKHKWHVAVECWKHGLYWQGIVHDCSKFRPREFFPYANYFYGKIKRKIQKEGYYKATDTRDRKFDMAWFWHLNSNMHHHQWWIIPGKPEDKIIEMEDKYVLEMVIDWKSSARCQKSIGSRYNWYMKNRGKMKLHKNTHIKILKYLKIINEKY